MPAMVLSGEAGTRQSLETSAIAGTQKRSSRQKEDNMRRSNGIIIALTAALGLGTLAAVTELASADQSTAEATYRDIEATLGSVPGFFKLFPAVGIAGAWMEFKSVQLNPDTELDGKTKELLGLAVASQIPCQYCVYFHTAAAKANGATEEEIREAVAMAAIVRHWSTVLNGMQVDLDTFQGEVDTVLRHAAESAKAAATSQ
jgi:AhpD family alkylhydroperoxidase